MSSPSNTDDCRHKIVTAKVNAQVAEAAGEILDVTCHLGSYVGSANSNNVIIKFAEPKVGSLRVSNVACDPKYCTRWNLMLGEFEKVVSKYKSHWYSDTGDADGIYALKEHLERYHNTIARNTAETSEPKEVVQSDGERAKDAAYWVHQAKLAKSQGEN